MSKRASVCSDDDPTAIGEDTVSEAPVSEETAQTAAVDAQTREAIAQEVTRQIEEENPVVASHGSRGFRLETRDGNWQTNLQWRAQFRYSNPTGADPRQLDDFAEEGTSSFEPRRLRMKIGGHGFRPWLKCYFEVDLQPAWDLDADPISSGARVIDWRVDVAK